MKKVENKYTKEVEQMLSRLTLNNSKEQSAKLKKYLGTKLHVHGLSSKTQNDVSKQLAIIYKDDIENIIFKLDQIYHSSYSFEGKNCVFILLNKLFKTINDKHKIEIIPHWVKSIDNWAHSDSLSKYLNKILLHSATHKELLTILKTWNSSENLWERRQSLVSLFYYSRTSNSHIDFKTAQQFILNLISDNEYYVQKAIGWTLRESYNIYPIETFKFIEKFILKITPIAFTTSIEKMSEDEIKILKLKRKIKK